MYICIYALIPRLLLQQSLGRGTYMIPNSKTFCSSFRFLGRSYHPVKKQTRTSTNCFPCYL